MPHTHTPILPLYTHSSSPPADILFFFLSVFFFSSHSHTLPHSSLESPSHLPRISPESPPESPPNLPRISRVHFRVATRRSRQCAGRPRTGSTRTAATPRRPCTRRSSRFFFFDAHRTHSSHMPHPTFSHISPFIRVFSPRSFFTPPTHSSHMPHPTFPHISPFYSCFFTKVCFLPHPPIPPICRTPRFPHISPFYS